MLNLIESLKKTKVVLNKEDLRQINNKLIQIIISADKIVAERNEINKLTKEIKHILNTHEEQNN